MTRKFNVRRYATAVYEIALETDALERWQSDLQKIADAMGDGQWLAAMESPRIRFDKKSQLLEEKLVGVSREALNFARLLITKNGIGMIREITAEYRVLLDAYFGIQKAHVLTAVPIDDTDKQKLAENLGAIVGARVVIDSDVDPDILGGVVARVGGKLLDGSTRSKLAALKRQLAGAGGRR